MLVGLALIAGGWWIWSRQQATATTPANVLETVLSNDLVITLSSDTGQLRQGANTFRIEFRSSSANEPVDVGTVQLHGSMSMPGMLMTSAIDIKPTGQAGVYEATGGFGMAGSWQMILDWNGPAGRGSAMFEGRVQ